MKIKTTDLVCLFRRRNPGLGVVLDIKNPKKHLSPEFTTELLERIGTSATRHILFDKEQRSYNANLDIATRNYNLTSSLREYFVAFSGLPTALSLEIMTNNNTFSINWWENSLEKCLKRSYALVYWSQPSSCYTIEKIKYKKAWYPSSWLKKVQ